MGCGASAGAVSNFRKVVPTPGGNPACLVISQDSTVSEDLSIAGGNNLIWSSMKSDNFQASDEHGHPSPPDRRMHDRHLRRLDRLQNFVVADPESFESEVRGRRGSRCGTTVSNPLQGSPSDVVGDEYLQYISP
ncbi:pkbA [Symbiodinium sp. CCMP2592]|nr:pkbA [Symbiodinium sp. CCMP2592]